MARGGKYKDAILLHCKKCGHTGKAVFEEDETPAHHPGTSGYDSRKLDGIDGPFRADANESFYCNDCGNKVR